MPLGRGCDGDEMRCRIELLKDVEERIQDGLIYIMWVGGYVLISRCFLPSVSPKRLSRYLVT